MQIEITKCKECPYLYTNRDDDMYCHHPKYYQRGGPVDVWPGDKVPKFCPMRGDSITLQIKEQHADIESTK